MGDLRIVRFAAEARGLMVGDAGVFAGGGVVPHEAHVTKNPQALCEALTMPPQGRGGGFDSIPNEAGGLRWRTEAGGGAGPTAPPLTPLWASDEADAVLGGGRGAWSGVLGENLPYPLTVEKASGWPWLAAAPGGDAAPPGGRWGEWFVLICVAPGRILAVCLVGRPPSDGGGVCR